MFRVWVLCVFSYHLVIRYEFAKIAAESMVSSFVLRPLDTFNWRLSCRHSNWETRTCPCTDSARCPGAQLSVFAQTSARISSCSRWAIRTGSSRCSSWKINGIGISADANAKYQMLKINNCPEFSCGPLAVNKERRLRLLRRRKCSDLQSQADQS